ncbi:MAG: hypothetical protein R3D61_04605 [Defluviimonas denitrificans]
MGTDVYGGPYLDRIDMSTLAPTRRPIAAAEFGRDRRDLPDHGRVRGNLRRPRLSKSEAVTSATICVRFNQLSDLYKDVKVRKALQTAVDNAQILELAMPALAPPKTTMSARST